MLLSRRALLAAPFLMAAESPVGPPALLPAGPGRVELAWAGRGAVWLPGPAAMLGGLALDGVGLAAVRLDMGPGLSLLALCGGERPRLLGLEVLRWRGADGAHLETRFSAVSDRRRIRLARMAARPVDRVRWQRAGWTDYLAWNAPLLVDAPVRPPPVGTWQARLEAVRAATLDWLAAPRAVLSVGDLEALGYAGNEAALF